MAERPTSLADDPKKALEDFLLELRQVYYPWYDRSVGRHYWLWLPIHLIGLFSGFATSIIAALATEESFKSFGLVRLLLVLLPALGAALSTVVVQSRLHERYQLRENGRIAIQNQWNEGRRKYAAARTAEEYSTIHAELVQRVNQIEAEQSASFFSLAGSRPSNGRQNNETP